MLVCPLCRIALGPNDTTCPRDGREGHEVELSPIPPELQQRFQVVEPFGQGETGTLYLADEVQTGRRGILKVLHAKSGASVADRQRLKRELVKQATLGNPHLALPLVTGETTGATWLFREWVEGVSLRVRLARDGHLAVTEALAIAAQLASALDELHRAGLLHRDLAPGHIMLQPQPSGVPKVIVVDAGIAAPIPSQQGFEIVGTPGYVSPEQASGKLVSFRSDLYALGCVLHEMITGAPPYQGSVDEVLKAHVEAPVPSAPSQLPAGVQGLLTQLLAKEPRERPFSAQQARRAIEPFLPEGGSPRDPTVSFEPQEHASVSTNSKGSGTLRPPERKATLLGIPAVQQQVAKPPAPPPDQGARVSAGPAKPPPPPGVKSTPPPPPGASKPTADSTQELDALDIEEVGVPAVPQALGAPPVVPQAAADAGGLDYDDLAETTLHLSTDMALEDEMPAPLGTPPATSPAIPPTQGMPLVQVDQSALENAAQSYMAQQPSPEQSGGFAPQAQAVGAVQAPVHSPSVEDVEVAGLPKKKKSKAGLFILLGVLFFCIGSAGALGGGYWYFTNKAEQELAALGAEWNRELGTAPATGAPFETGTPAPGTEAEVVPPPTQPSEPAAEAQPSEPAAVAEEAPPEPAAEAREQRTEERTAREERAAREERTAREQPRERREAREERSGSSGGSRGSQFEQLREEARQHFAARRFAQAAAAYERAAAINPNHAGTFAGLGAARGAMGDSRGAVVAYQRAVELQPNHSGFNAALGRAYMTAGDRARAIQAYQRALALDPNNQAARQSLERLGAQ